MAPVRAVIAGASIRARAKHTADASEGSSSSASMTSMPGARVAAQATKTGRGTGTVTAIDTAGGKITLDHSPIPELGWPAMKMAFKANPSVIGSTAVRTGRRLGRHLVDRSSQTHPQEPLPRSRFVQRT